MILLPVGDENPASRVPYVHYTIMGVNFAVFFYGLFQDYSMISRYGFYPDHPSVLTGVASMFLHAGIFHLLGNMLFLGITGDNVEDRYGHVGYLLFYFAGGGLSLFAYSHIAAGMGRFVPLVGASGAISAVLGAYVALFPKAKIKFWGIIWFIVPIYKFNFRLPALVAIGAWFVEQYLAQLAAGHDLTGVAYAAHVGGFLVGAVATLSLVLLGVLRADWEKLTG